MKKTFYLLFFALTAITLFNSNAGGKAAASGEGMTGAPGDQKLANGTSVTCQSCHNGGSFNPTGKIELFDDAGTAAVTKYEAGKTYTIRYTIAAGAGTPSGYGFQMIDIRKSNSANIKGFSATQATGIQITNVTTGTQANRSYAEHSSRRASNVFNVKWKAPAVGTGAVVFYATGLAANGNSSDSGDNGAASVSVEMAELTASTNELAANVAMTLSPNPITEGVFISLSSKTNKKIQVRMTDINGRIILTENHTIQAGENNIKLQTSSLSKGAYMIQVIENQDVISKKIVKL